MNAYRIAGLLLIFSLVACSTPNGDEPDDAQQLSQEPAPEPEPDPVEPLLTEAQQTFDDRQDLQDIDAAIDLWERAIHKALDATDDRHASLSLAHQGLAEAHFLAARFHLPSSPAVKDDDAVADRAALAEEHALEALELHSSPLVDDLTYDELQNLDRYFGELDDAALPALLLYAKARDLRAHSSTTTAQVQAAPITDAIMEHLQQRSPDIHQGAPHLYFGVRHITRPFNKNADKSSQAFAQSLQVDPDTPWTHLLMAVHLHPFEDDDDARQQRLQTIVDHDPDDSKKGPPEQTIVRQWAQELLDQF